MGIGDQGKHPIVAEGGTEDEDCSLETKDIGAGRAALGTIRLGFIGCGNMAQALLNGFLKNGLVQHKNVTASAPSDRNLCKLRGLGVATTHENSEVIESSDIIFLSVKPHLLEGAVQELKPVKITHNPLFVSIVSGISLKSLEEMLAPIVPKPRVVRTMPNTPSLVSQGCCVYSLGSYVKKEEGQIVNQLMSAVGICEQVPESQIDAICGLSGSGPAYIYMAIEALADGGVKMGLPRQLAQKFAAQTVKGAATMVLETGKHPAKLKDEVCSPGGTTIAAVHALEMNGLRNALMSAVEASACRSKELGKK
ncbi:pyrroline-5-carboxylate reductase 3-like [Oratosquilla oratoria]|uniref:pyrroline-5-carboxylate reductase 3-like n=1 Tax=Oratosquilla oratoria TaxID=337810 RepID=UPI003F764CF4